MDETTFYSQYGEDQILERVFAGRAHGVCVEVGANDGMTGSATLVFEKKGWKCLLVEPVPALAERIRNSRAAIVCECAASDQEGEAPLFVVENSDALSTLQMTEQRSRLFSQLGGQVREIRVRKRTLDQMLTEHHIDKIDFITVDVEGHELEALRGFSLTVFNPRIVIIEDNLLQRDPTVLRYMADRGYVNFRRTGVNDWYAHSSDSDLLDHDEMKRLGRARKRARVEGRIIKSFRLISHHLPMSFKAACVRGLSRVVRTIRLGI